MAKNLAEPLCDATLQEKKIVKWPFKKGIYSEK